MPFNHNIKNFIHKTVCYNHIENYLHRPSTYISGSNHSYAKHEIFKINSYSDKFLDLMLNIGHSESFEVQKQDH